MARSVILASFLLAAGVYAARVANKSTERESQAIAYASDFVPRQLLPRPLSAASPGAPTGISSVRVGNAPQINLHEGVGHPAFSHGRSSWVSMQDAGYLPDLRNDWKSSHDDFRSFEDNWKPADDAWISSNDEFWKYDFGMLSEPASDSWQSLYSEFAYPVIGDPFPYIPNFYDDPPTAESEDDQMSGPSNPTASLDKERQRGRLTLMSQSQNDYNLYLAEMVESLDTGGIVSCTIYKHTHLCLRRYESTRWMAAPGQKVRCLALTHVEVKPSKRRQGRARKTLYALKQFAADNGYVLIVENVVSTNMHALIAELHGEALPGSRPGAKGAHYWLPPSRGKTWQDMAL